MKVFFKILSQNIIIVLLVIGIIVALNVLSKKYSVRLDLTDDKEYTLSPATIKLLGRLQDRLTVKLYYSKDLPPILLPIKERVGDILEEFKATAKQNVIIEYIEPDLNEEMEKEALNLGVLALELNVIEKDRREVKKAYMGMVLYYQDKRQVIPVVAQVKNLEYLLDLSLIKLMQKKSPKIGVYMGIDKNKFRLVQQILGQMGQVVEVTPETKDLDELDLSVLLVLAPLDVDKKFYEQWNKLIKKGTNVLVFTSNLKVQTSLKVEELHSGLDDWLANLGLGISDKLLIDPKQNAQAGFMTGYVQVYMAYPFWVKVFKKQLDQKNPITSRLEELLYPWSNVVMIYEQKESPWDIVELVSSSNYSFLQPDDVPSVSPQYVNEMTKFPVFEPFPLTVMLTNNDKESSGKVFVTANYHVLQDQFLQQSQSNAIFLENMIEFSTWGNNLIGIRSRGKTARPLAEVTPGEKSVIKWGLMIGVPIFAILIGLTSLFVLKKRREKLIAGLGV